MADAMTILGRDGRTVLRTLSPGTQSFILDELRMDPSQAATIRKLLSTADPERAIAEAISHEIAHSIATGMSGYGLGFKMPKLKNIVKSAESVVKKAPEVVKKVASYSSLPAVALTHTTTGKKLVQDVRKAAKTYGPLALTVGAVVLAPFTGGATMAIPALIQARQAALTQKRVADKAAEAAQADAGTLNTQATQMETQSTNDIDSYYRDNQSVFVNAGYPPSRWATMSTDDKYAALNSLQTAAQAVGQDLQNTIDSINTPVGIEQPPASQAPSAPAGTYDLVIEGQKVATAQSLDELAPKIESMTKPGDRFEILFNGQSTGLKIRTTAGMISVPANQVDQVKAMSAAQVQDVVAKSTAAAQDQPKSGFPLWLLAIPAAAIAVTR